MKENILKQTIMQIQKHKRKLTYYLEETLRQLYNMTKNMTNKSTDNIQIVNFLLINNHYLKVMFGIFQIFLGVFFKKNYVWVQLMQSGCVACWHGSAGPQGYIQSLWRPVPFVGTGTSNSGWWYCAMHTVWWGLHLHIRHPALCFTLRLHL